MLVRPRKNISGDMEVMTLIACSDISYMERHTGDDNFVCVLLIMYTHSCSMAFGLDLPRHE
jgi:hypothetical protein